MIKDLLIHVDESESCSSRLHAGKLVANESDAHVTGMFTYQISASMGYGDFGIPSDVLTNLEKAHLERAAMARKHFDRTTETWQSKTSWECHEGDRASTISSVSAHHDLVLLSQFNENDEQDHNKGIAAQVAIDSGRPVMVVPHSFYGDHIGKRIFVAWNGKKESVRATHDAMPFLQAADAVEIARINQSNGEDLPCIDIANHLARHGVNIESSAAQTPSMFIGEAILYMAQGFGADMIVMGAYGHTRLREIILGGATRHVLAKSHIPVLVSH